MRAALSTSEIVPAMLAVDHGEHRLALVVAVDPAVPGVVAGTAAVDADEVDDHDHAVEELDADPRRHVAGRRIEVLEGDRHRPLPGDAALGRPGLLRRAGRIGRRRGGQQHRQRRRAPRRGRRTAAGTGPRRSPAGWRRTTSRCGWWYRGCSRSRSSRASQATVREARSTSPRDQARKRVHPVPLSGAAQTTSLTARLVRRSRCHRTNVP